MEITKMQHYNIYIIGMYDRRITGFYTYKRELSRILKELPYATVSIVNIRCPFPEFQIAEDDGVVTYNCPVSPHNPLEVSGGLLSLYVDDLETNIFLVNYAPSTPTIRMLRAYFGHGRILYVIHDFMWASFLCGDLKRLKGIVQNTGSTPLDQLVARSYEDGKKTFELSDGIVCLSEDTYQLLWDLYKVPKAKLALIANGLSEVETKDIDLASPMWSENGKVLLYVGRASEQKGIIALLKSFGKVLDFFPECKLVIIGEVDGKVLGGMDDRIRANVLFLGTQPKDNVYAWYRRADIGILPSYYEQCSYTGIEMKMFGLPVISSDGFGIRRMFTSDNAIIAPIGNRGTPDVFQESLAASIIEALSCTRERLAELKHNSRQDYLRRYSSGRLLDGYEHLFEKLYEVNLLTNKNNNYEDYKNSFD